MRGSRKWFGPTILAGALVAAMVAPASASGERIEPTEPTPWEDSEGGDQAELAHDLWFVEFHAPPSARGGSAAARANERTTFRANARARGLDAEQQKDFRTLWNGITIRADADEIAEIRAMRTVKAVYPVAVIEQPDPSEVDPDLATALSMTGADAAQSELGLTGEGLSVAIIDTGIDYNHPDLGGTGDDTIRIEADPNTRAMNHPRITHGWDYVGAEFNPANPDAPTDPDPNPDPRDTQGHGTHVAGIVGADAADEDGVTGVAPGVTFGAYKVFGPGSTTSDVIVEALEDAFTDGMDIVNMSLGAAFAWGQDYPTTAASNELAANGVVVVNSAGNSGGDGLWTLSAPANAHDIISVASADNTHVNARAFEVEQLDDPVPYMELTGAELPPTAGESDPLVSLGRACTQTMGDTLEADPDGKVALIVRGDCTFSEKYLAAANAGATGVIIYNNVAGLFAGTVGEDGRDGVWGAGISRDSGLALRGLLADGETVTVQFTDGQVTASNPTGGLASSFTSYGQDVELAFGPSVMAPGGLIVSTYPLARGGYASLSGTSMAAPHVAGAVALLLEAEPQLDPFDVRDRLQNTASPQPWSLNPGLGFSDHTFRQGAGMIQIDQAVRANQTVEPAQVALGDDTSKTVTLTIRNRESQPVTYTLAHDPGLEAAISTYTPGFYLYGAGVAADRSSVRVQGNRTAQINVTITAPQAGLPNHQFGGYLELIPNRATATTLRVPYVGFDGDYVAEMGLFGYWSSAGFVEATPQLRTPNGQALRNRHRFTFEDGDQPVLWAFFGHFPRQMNVYAVDADGGRQLLIEEEYLRRSPGANQYWTFPLPGTDANGDPLADGEYRLEVEALRATGDAAESDHWDRWTSATFRVERDDSDPDGPGGPPPGRGPNR